MPAKDPTRFSPSNTRLGGFLPSTNALTFAYPLSNRLVLYGEDIGRRVMGGNDVGHQMDAEARGNAVVPPFREIVRVTPPHIGGEPPELSVI